MRDAQLARRFDDAQETPIAIRDEFNLLAEVTQVRIAAGADVNAEAEMQGGASTMDLLAGSVHAAEPDVAGEVVRILTDARAGKLTVADALPETLHRFGLQRSLAGLILQSKLL